MPYQQGPFQIPGGLTLYEHRWLPEREVRAVVVFVHGVAEHAGRYADLAESFNREGHAVWAWDLRGHGRSAGAPIGIRSFDEYLDDLDHLLDRVREAMPEVPLFLMGQSMGSTIILLSAIEREPRADGVIVSAAAVRVGELVLINLLWKSWHPARDRRNHETARTSTICGRSGLLGLGCDRRYL